MSGYLSTAEIWATMLIASLNALSISNKALALTAGVCYRLSYKFDVFRPA
jgi:hypothetical protein